MLSAFTPQSLVELKARDRSRIEAVLAYGDRLLVGFNTGSLKVYRVHETESRVEDDAHEQPPSAALQESSNAHSGTEAPDASKRPSQVPTRSAELLQEHEKFSRYKIEQLAIIKEANQLVSLSGGYVALHDLQSYELQTQLLRTKGAATFAVSTIIENDSTTAIPSIVSRLAVAVKRRLLIWTWVDSELVEDDELGTGALVRETTLPSGIKSLTWANGKKLVAGLSSGYVIVDIPTMEYHAVSGPGSIGSVGQESSRYGMSYIGMGAGPKPLAAALSGGEILLAKDLNSLFLDQDGHSLGRKQIPWTSAPEAIGYSYPYVLSLQDQYKGILEVRNPQTLSLLQSISLPSATTLHIPQPYVSLAHAGKGFLVASERVIWSMVALDYDSQIDSLVEAGHLDEAISLLNMLEDALLTDKPGRLRQTRLCKAKRLFEQRKYRDALDIFTEVSAPPETLIRLYPKSIAGLISTFVEETDEDDDHSSPASEGQESESPSASDADKSKSAAMGVSGGYAPSVRSLLLGRSSEDVSSSSSSKTPQSPRPVDRALVGKDLEVAVRELRSYLADIRRRVHRYIDDQGRPETATLKQDLADADPFAVSVMQLVGGTIDDENDAALADRLLATATLVDTTLFRAYMFTNARLAGSLFRIPNCCDPDVVMEKLEETKRYNDLIDFLYGKKLHARALAELQRFGQIGEQGGSSRASVADETPREEGPCAASSTQPDAAQDVRQDERADKELRKEDIPTELIGPRRTVAYLQHLPPSFIDLILQYAEWPLRTDPALGMEVFIADSENAELLPRHRVLAFLLEIDRQLARRYLEHVIHELGDLDMKLHEQLLALYLEHLLNGADGQPSPADHAAEPESESQHQSLEDSETAVDPAEGTASDSYSNTRRKFLSLLEESSQYSPARMLERIPRNNPDFFEAQAILFSKMGQDKLALEIYVFKLNDPVKAEQYCNKVHAAAVAAEQASQKLAATARKNVNLESSANSPGSASPNLVSNRHKPWGNADSDAPSIYHTLLGLYLAPPHGHPPQHQQALEILARHGSRLTADSTLDLIPKSFPIRDLEFFFRTRMRNSISALHRSKIELGLRANDNVTVTRRLAIGDDGNNGLAGPLTELALGEIQEPDIGRCRSVVISAERLCRVCLKRVGSSVISVFPDNTVVHLGCANRHVASLT